MLKFCNKNYLTFYKCRMSQLKGKKNKNEKKETITLR